MTNEVQILKGGSHEDQRGIICFNNDFDLSLIKRAYTITNHSIEFIRGWQGHKIESRWFASMKGEFEIMVIKLLDFDNPDSAEEIQKFLLSDNSLSFLHVPHGHITAIRACNQDNKLLVLADYNLNEIQDEYRFDLNTFL